MYYCTVFTCPELYFDSPGANLVLVLGVAVTVGIVVKKLVYEIGSLLIKLFSTK